MIQALSDADNIIDPAPDVEGAICPLCRDPVIAKCGDIVTWHFAHRAREDCDPWSEAETPWHRDWKYSVGPEQREVVIAKAHRADMLAGDGTVIELQHSSISVEDIYDREDFYRRMRWVFDVADCRRRIDIAEYSYVDDGRREFSWRHPRKHIAATNDNVENDIRTYLDLGNGWLFRIGRFDLERGYNGENGYGWLVKRSDFVAWLNRPPRLGAR